MLTSSCRNCGQAKDRANYADPFCPACVTLGNEGAQHFAAENAEKIAKGEVTESDILYAGRMAMGQRSIRPGNNYINPRDFSAARRAGGGVDNRLPGDRGNPIP